jgi:hypothetical protein
MQKERKSVLIFFDDIGNTDLALVTIRLKSTWSWWQKSSGASRSRRKIVKGALGYVRHLLSRIHHSPGWRQTGPVGGGIDPLLHS